MTLACKERMTDYTADEIDQHLEESGFAQVPNSGDPNRGAFHSILAGEADNRNKRLSSGTISV
jgi:hypothetical protein